MSPKENNDEISIKVNFSSKYLDGSGARVELSGDDIQINFPLVLSGAFRLVRLCCDQAVQSGMDVFEEPVCGRRQDIYFVIRVLREGLDAAGLDGTALISRIYQQSKANWNQQTADRLSPKDASIWESI